MRRTAFIGVAVAAILLLGIPARRVCLTRMRMEPAHIHDIMKLADFWGALLAR